MAHAPMNVRFSLSPALTRSRKGVPLLPALLPCFCDLCSDVALQFWTTSRYHQRRCRYAAGKGVRCGARCEGNNCAYKCEGFQCGLECDGRACAYECEGVQCAARCGATSSVGDSYATHVDNNCAYGCKSSILNQYCKVSLSLSHSLTLTLTHAPSHTHTHTHTLSLSLPLSLSLSLSHAHSHSRKIVPLLPCYLPSVIPIGRCC